MISFAKRRKFISKIGELGLIVFLIALGISFVDSIWAVYVYDYTQSDVTVGLISALLTAVSLISFVTIIPFLEKHSKCRLFKLTLALSALCYILFAVTKSLWSIIILGIFFSIINVIRIDTFGIIVSDSSKKGELAKNEGIVYTTANCGWLVGPLISAYFAEKYGMSLIFLLAAFFLFFALFSYWALSLHSKRRIVKKADGDFFKNIKDFFKNKDFLKNYIISGAPSVWWSFTWIYVPVYIIKQGLGLQWVSYFLFATMLPVIGLEYYFGKWADKTKYRSFFISANILLGILLILAFFVQNIYFLLILFILGSIGIAMLESSTEAYFFLIAPKKRLEKYYSIYNTALDVFSIIGKLSIAGILAILSFKYSFLVVALLFFSFAWISFYVKEISGQTKH